MNAQTLVIIAGLVLLAAVIGSLIFLRGYSGKFTFDTKNGTRPKASEGEGNTSGLAYKGRFTMLTAGVGVMFGAILAKLWSMQMVRGDYYEDLSVQNRTRTVTTAAPRGRILDRNGVELVRNRALLAVTAYSDLVDDPVLVRHLSNVLGMPYAAVRRNIRDNTEGAQAQHTIATDVRRSTIAYIQEHAGEFEGVTVVDRTEREYPYGTLACHVLGYTGTITAEQLEAQDSEERDEGSIVYETGDIVGQAGVEAQYESLLQGVRGEQTVTVDAAGNVTGQVGEVPPRSGTDIRLTLDVNIQRACEEGLAYAISISKQFGYNEAGNGAMLCLDCTNGEILGMASTPTYDPSVFIGGISNDAWSQLNGDESGNPLLNRAIGGQYMSASTIKPLSALAGLEYGVYSSTRTTTCTGYWTGDGEAYGKWCWDHSGHGVMTLEDGIIYSCDPVFYDIGHDFFYDKDNPEGLQEMFRRWGLGSTTGVDLPSEQAGRVPDAAWKKEYFSDYSDEDRTWNPGDMSNIVIGQGDLLVTPLQMACAYMGIANGGKEYTPHVFLSALARDGEGGDSYRYNETGSKERLTAEVDSAYLDLVHSGLKRMIYEESATLAAHFSSLPVTVAGKSGTGEKAGQDPYGWFITYAPYENPKYVVCGVLEQGGFGGSSTVYGVRDVLGQIYNAPDSMSPTDSDRSM
ncbi:penicillin-binding protein 2 [[Collinsella] massiliensis]|uniref:Penicillin-binding protein 2 n=1 Tax=[Collinsella] massiliensis TaxID=1232426 RepID=A0A1Y3Y0A9_9ACTN|nr:penicillin-binding protein 2 [[Collinsella] massiliensis]OUN88927.1 penicillin-binding protein 2 [[Collinsella] massiliensis]